MDPQRLASLRNAMKSAGLNALFLTNPKNVLYLTGIAPMMEGSVMPFNDPEYFTLVQQTRCDVLCDGRYIAGIQGRPGFTANLLEAPVSAKVIGDKILSLLSRDVNKIGYESDAMLHKDAVALQQHLPTLAWKPAEEIPANLRIIKSRDEIETIRKAQALTGQAFEHICKTIRVGMSEKQVALT